MGLDMYLCRKTEEVAYWRKANAIQECPKSNRPGAFFCIRVIKPPTQGIVTEP